MKLFVFHLFLLSCNLIFAQTDTSKQYNVVAIGFYNLENLHDTIFDADTTKVMQDDYTPNGDKKWDTEKYYHKLSNLSRVISEMATEVTPDGIAILGISEIENKAVIEDLVKTEKLKARNYQIVHYESPDRRGVDVGLIYNPNYFKVVSSKSYTLKMAGDDNFLQETNCW